MGASTRVPGRVSSILSPVTQQRYSSAAWIVDASQYYCTNSSLYLVVTLSFVLLDFGYYFHSDKKCPLELLQDFLGSSYTKYSRVSLLGMSNTPVAVY